jgi:pyruvate formate lyase activating enzyme
VVFNIMRFALHDGPGIRTTVFLKGCPLSCWWCHNPESLRPAPEIVYFPERCRLCGDCIPACPAGAIELRGRTLLRSQACRSCGACVEACLAGARELAGRRMTVSEVLREVERDAVFFDESGGGVTLSGGEPLAQPWFAEPLLAGCRERRIHTTLDTCGFAPRSDFLRVAARADLVLFDLKLTDPDRHLKYTGVSNQVILENLEALSRTGRALVVRVPVIPGVNDDDEEVERLAGLLSDRGIRRVDLLPYHRIGADKYRRFGLSYRMAELEPPSPACMARIAEKLARAGLDVRQGG